MSENWRPETNGYDYLLHQQKKGNLADRRPVIRRASDLVGPGIADTAVRITDFNNLLATFNGYYSAAVGASGAPNNTEAFVGYVISDGELGGRQVFTGLTSGTEYRRTFNRSPVDPESLGWTAWTGQRIPATATGGVGAMVYTQVQNGAMTVLAPPLLAVAGDASVYERSDGGVRFLRQGIYSGTIELESPNYIGTTASTVVTKQPNGTTIETVSRNFPNVGSTVIIPFTCVAKDDNQGISVAVLHNAGAGIVLTFQCRFYCTRLGDAV